MKILVLAPNWLGDAVMAVPSVQAVRRRHAEATLAVAARAHLAPFYEMVAGVDQVVPLAPAGWLSAMRDARRLRAMRFDLAILLPNSFRSAWIAWQAAIPGRIGYAADGRSLLLSRALPIARGVHQVEYYQRLVDALETSEPRTPDAGRGTPDAGRPASPSILLDIPADAREWARRTLEAHGWHPGVPLVGMAPGAAYGGAKQWAPERFGRVAAGLAEAGVRTVLVGSVGDRAACEAAARGAGQAINVAGLTDLRQLAAVMAECRVLISNDSGAMHLAAAVGVPVVAIFGPTREKETSPVPIADPARPHTIVTSEVACRPCMLRECPVEGHPCMTGIEPDRVAAEVRKYLRGAVPALSKLRG